MSDTNKSDHPSWPDCHCYSCITNALTGLGVEKRRLEMLLTSRVEIINDLRAKLSEVEEGKATLTSHLAAKNKLIIEFQRKNSDLLAANGDLLNKQARQEKLMTEASITINDLTAERDQLRADRAAVDARYYTASGMNQKLRDSVANLIETRDRLATTNKMLNAEIAVLKEDVRVLRSANKDLADSCVKAPTMTMTADDLVKIIQAATGQDYEVIIMGPNDKKGETA